MLVRKLSQKIPVRNFPNTTEYFTYFALGDSSKRVLVRKLTQKIPVHRSFSLTQVDHVGLLQQGIKKGAGVGRAVPSAATEEAGGVQFIVLEIG